MKKNVFMLLFFTIFFAAIPFVRFIVSRQRTSLRSQGQTVESQLTNGLVINARLNVSNYKVGRLPPNFRLCQSNTIKAPNHTELLIPYSCAGPRYTAFGTHLMELYQNISLSRPQLARRPTPIPNNKHVFAFGNSHTRQQVNALLCQYSDQIKSLRCDVWECKKGLVVAQFENNASMTLLINDPVAYRPDWVKELDVMGIGPLIRYHAIVLGFFNGMYNSKNTTFEQEMLEAYHKTNGTVDFLKNPPPNVSTVAEVYSGALVAVSPFATNLAKATFHMNTHRYIAALKKQGRAHAGYINGRTYVKDLGECSSDMQHEVQDCEDKGGHRCTGLLGGHPDLIAWELAEWFHTNLI